MIHPPDQPPPPRPKRVEPDLNIPEPELDANDPTFGMTDEEVIDAFEAVHGRPILPPMPSFDTTGRPPSHPMPTPSPATVPENLHATARRRLNRLRTIAARWPLTRSLPRSRQPNPASSRR